jgi:hypothetical protein
MEKNVTDIDKVLQKVYGDGRTKVCVDWIVFKVHGRMLHIIKGSAAEQLQGNPNVREIKTLNEMARNYCQLPVWETADEVKIKEKKCEIHMRTICARMVPTDL